MHLFNYNRAVGLNWFNDYPATVFFLIQWLDRCNPNGVPLSFFRFGKNIFTTVQDNEEPVKLKSCWSLWIYKSVLRNMWIRYSENGLIISKAVERTLNADLRYYAVSIGPTDYDLAIALCGDGKIWKGIL